MSNEGDFDDLHTFTTKVNDTYTDGGKLKSTSSDYWDAPNTGAENLFGFDVRGGGVFADGVFSYKEGLSNFWTSSIKNSLWFLSSLGLSKIGQVGITDQMFSIRFCRDATPTELSYPNGTEIGRAHV